MKKIVTLLGMTVALACTGAAFAHPEHDDAPVAALKKLEAKKNANGATIYVTNAGEVVPTAGATGTLTLLSGSKKQVVKLQPGGTNTLEARTTAKIAAGSKAQADITFADKSTASAELTIN